MIYNEIKDIEFSTPYQPTALNHMGFLQLRLGVVETGKKLLFLYVFLYIVYTIIICIIGGGNSTLVEMICRRVRKAILQQKEGRLHFYLPTARVLFAQSFIILPTSF